MNQETKDKFDRLMKRFSSFGTVVEIHKINIYQIVEYLEITKYKNEIGEIQTLSVPKYGCCVDFDVTHSSFKTMDEALAFCIAYKYEGINCHAHNYFLKMIGAIGVDK